MDALFFDGGIFCYRRTMRMLGGYAFAFSGTALANDRPVYGRICRIGMYGRGCGPKNWADRVAFQWFSRFYAIAGYALGAGFSDSIAHIYPWVAAILLVGMGLNMIRQAGREESRKSQGIAASTAVLALATSVDALTVGVAFAFLEVNVWQAGVLMAVIMSSLSLLGSAFGSRIGARYRYAARLTGGLILLLLGVKIICARLGLIGF